MWFFFSGKVSQTFSGKDCCIYEAKKEFLEYILGINYSQTEFIIHQITYWCFTELSTDHLFFLNIDSVESLIFPYSRSLMPFGDQLLFTFLLLTDFCYISHKHKFTTAIIRVDYDWLGDRMQRSGKGSGGKQTVCISFLHNLDNLEKEKS